MVIAMPFPFSFVWRRAIAPSCARAGGGWVTQINETIVIKIYRAVVRKSNTFNGANGAGHDGAFEA